MKLLAALLEASRDERVEKADVEGIAKRLEVPRAFIDDYIYDAQGAITDLESVKNPERYRELLHEPIVKFTTRWYARVTGATSGDDAAEDWQRRFGGQHDVREVLRWMRDAQRLGFGYPEFGSIERSARANLGKDR
jgi:hypothetical protein